MFTKARYLGSVKIREFFIKKHLRMLLVCQRTARGYRPLMAVHADGVIYPHEMPGRVEPMTTPKEMLVSKSTLLRLIKDRTPENFRGGAVLLIKQFSKSILEYAP